MSQVTQGKDATNMDPRTNPGFWSQAMWYGGGLGIVGDFLKDMNRKDMRDFATHNSGPIVSSAIDVGNVVVGKNHGKALAQALRNNLPGSSLWYTKLAFQREILDQMQALMDPDYRKSAARMERSARERGTRYWWSAFKTAPDRAPEMSDQVPKHAN